MPFRKRRRTSNQRSATDRQCARRFLRLLQLGTDLRRAKVKHLRRSIEQGSYENDLKLNIAADRLFDDR